MTDNTEHEIDRVASTYTPETLQVMHPATLFRGCVQEPDARQRRRGVDRVRYDTGFADYLGGTETR